MSKTTSGNGREKTVPEIVSANLKALKKRYSNEIPGKVLHSYSGEPNNFKALKGVWFTPVVAYLSIGISQGEITDPQVKGEITGFIKRYTSKGFHQQALTTRGDIERANHTIDLYLQNCKTK